MHLSDKELVDMILNQTAENSGFSVEEVRNCLTEIVERAIKEDDIIFKDWQEELGELNLEKVLLKLKEIITGNRNPFA